MRRWFIIAAAAGGSLLLSALIALWLVYRATQQPVPWYEDVVHIELPQAGVAGDELEQHVLALVSDVKRPNERWEAIFSDEQVNGWLAADLVDTLTLTVAVGSAALPSVTNTVSVSSPTFDNIPANDIARDPTTVLGPAAANKPLYLYGETGRELSRTPPTGFQELVQIRGTGEQAVWSLTPLTASALTVPAGLLPVRLWIERTNQGSSRTLSVALSSSGTTSATVPSATRSSSSAMFGSARERSNHALSRNAALTASIR